MGVYKLFKLCDSDADLALTTVVVGPMLVISMIERSYCRDDVIASSLLVGFLLFRLALRLQVSTVFSGALFDELIEVNDGGEIAVLPEVDFRGWTNQRSRELIGPTPGVDAYTVLPKQCFNTVGCCKMLVSLVIKVNVCGELSSTRVLTGDSLFTT